MVRLSNDLQLLILLENIYTRCTNIPELSRIELNTIHYLTDPQTGSVEGFTYRLYSPTGYNPKGP